MDNYSIKANLKKYREERKLTQQDMAELLGMSRVNYNCIENGSTKLISDNIEKLANAINLSQEELILGYKPNYEETQHLSDIKVEYNKRTNNLIADYEERLLRKDELIKSLQETIKAQSKTIDVQEDKILMLEKRIKTEK